MLSCPAHPGRQRKCGPSAMTGDNTDQLKFILGLGAGVVASLLVWKFKLGGGSEIPTRIYVLLACKIGGAVLLTFFPRWRPVATGLLISLFAGVMIFLFTCGGSW